MKDKKFWPEQIKEARTLAIQEKKLLAREYDAFSDADGLRVLTKGEFEELKGSRYSCIMPGGLQSLRTTRMRLERPGKFSRRSMRGSGNWMRKNR